MELEQIEQTLVSSGNIILEFNKGHMKQFGVDAGILKNPYWKVLHQASQKEFIFMSIGHGKVTKLCPISFQKIQEYEQERDDKMTFFAMQNGYVGSSDKLYLHQIILKHFGNGAGTMNTSVDHIDRDPLNNTWENLRIATREEQEQNSKGIMAGTKRERKHSAKELPDGLTQEMMKKYVVFYRDEAYGNRKAREFFKIEKHPKLPKIWIGCKRADTTIQAKLAQANKVVDDLEKDIYPILPNHTYAPGVKIATREEPEIKMPKHCFIKKLRGKSHLEFDKRCEDGTRMTLRMVFDPEEDWNLSLTKLKTKVETKYGPNVFPVIDDDDDEDEDEDEDDEVAK